MKRIAMAATALALVATGAVAQNMNAPLKARQGQMWVVAINLGVLGGMAKGEVEYDAGRAQAAADSLVGVAMIDQMSLWPEGSDDMSIDGTRALPAMWENQAKVDEIWAQYIAAAQNMQAMAGQGRDQLGPALGQLGGTCKSCHDTFRAPQ